MHVDTRRISANANFPAALGLGCLQTASDRTSFRRRPITKANHKGLAFATEFAQPSLMLQSWELSPEYTSPSTTMFSLLMSFSRPSLLDSVSPGSLMVLVGTEEARVVV